MNLDSLSVPEKLAVEDYLAYFDGQLGEIYQIFIEKFKNSMKIEIERYEGLGYKTFGFQLYIEDFVDNVPWTFSHPILKNKEYLAKRLFEKAKETFSNTPPITKIINNVYGIQVNIDLRSQEEIHRESVSFIDTVDLQRIYNIIRATWLVV